jgi:proteic killer suppression protein
MIVSFKHKGLELFFKTGNKRGIQAKHEKKLKLILDLLDVANEPENMNFSGAMLHLLEPRKNQIYAVRVSGNWRVTFRLNSGGDAEIVDYLDYH